jgi:hypothetical protein
MKRYKAFMPVFTLVVFLLLPAQSGGVNAAPAISESTPVAGAASEPFTATTGLEEFTSYRMNFSGEVDGTRQGRPTSGSLAGVLEVTKNPEAQHLGVRMTGDAFSGLAPLGSMEIYEVDHIFYIQNPQNGSWLTVPAFLIDTMLPGGVPTPEESIDVPVSAVLQPGTEIVNGVVTQRYTFGPDDLAGELETRYDHVEGTIWVAIEGNYIVKYEAAVSGQFTDAVAEVEAKSGRFGNLLGGDLSLIDEGTITMRYELSDVNDDFTIAPPAGVGGFNFGFNLGGLFN